MILKAMRIVLLTCLLSFIAGYLFSQYTSRDNYTGNWEADTSWIPVWSDPPDSLNGINNTINGYIVKNSTLEYYGTAIEELVINDTLIINGDLILDNKCNITINDNGILIVRGNLKINNKSNIIANGYFVVMGNVYKIGSELNGTFLSNDNPVKVFIGGTVDPDLTNHPLYSALNSVSPPTIPYPGSGASYGNITDLLADPVVSSFYTSTCKLANAAGNSPVCTGTNLILLSSPGTSFSWTGPNGFTSSLRNPVIPNASVSVEGTYTVLIKSNGCADTTVNVSILTRESPVATASASTSSLCAGSTINLSSSGGIAYSWTGPDGFTSTTQNPSLINADLIMSGAYKVTVTGANGCTDTGSVSVTVNPLPSVSITSSSGPLCVNGERILAGNPSGGVFTVTSGPGSITGNVLTATGPGTINLLYSYTDLCTNTAGQSIIVNENPVAVAGVNVASICEGGTIELTSSGGGTYSWSGPGGFISTDQNPSISNAQIPMTGNYTVTVTNLSGCTDSESVPVTVGASPVITSSGDPMCVSTQRTLTGSPAGGIFTLISGSGSITGDVLTATGAGTINISYSSPACSGSVTQSIIVNPNPVATAGYNAGTICEGTSINLTSSGGTGYSWSGTGNFTSSDQNPVIMNATPSMSGSYTVTVTDGNGCTGSESISVTVTALPSVFITSSSDPLCAGLTRTLTGSPAGGIFSIVSGPGSLAGNILTANGTGTINIIYTWDDVCDNTAVQSIIAADPIASAGVNSPVVCTGSTINLAASGGATYAWTGPAGFTSAEQNPDIINAAAVNDGIYSVTVTDVYGCSDAATVDVGVDPGTGSAVFITSSNSALCINSTRTLTGSPAGGSFMIVSGPGSLTGDLLTATGSGTIEIIYSHGVVCSSTTTQSITVNPDPVVTAGVNAGIICEGTVLSFTSSAGSLYSWTGPGGFSSTEQNPQITNAGLVNTGEYKVVLTDGNGCRGSGSVDVVITALPVVNITSTGDPMCVGATRVLTASPSGGVFTVTGGPGSIAGNVLTATGAGAISILYTYTGDCTNTAGQTITINANPVAVAGVNTGTICFGSTINLTASGGTSYLWTGPNGLNAAAQNPSISRADLSDSGIYTVTVTDANGCSDAESVDVAVVALPVVSITSSSAAMCVNAQRNLSALPAGGTFSVTGGPGIIEGNVLTATGSGIISILYTWSDACSNTAMQSITANANPVASAGANATFICEGKTIELTSSGGDGYGWLGPNGFTSTGKNPVIPGAVPAMSGKYIVTVTDTNGCIGKDSADITVGALPVAVAGVNSGTICAGTNINLTSSGGVSYSWTGPDGFISAVQNPVITAAKTSMSGTFSVMVTDVKGCTAQASVAALISPLPAVSITSSSNPLCEGAVRVLSGLPSGGTFGVLSGPASIAGNTLSPSGTGAVEIIYTCSQGGCSNSVKQAFDIIPFPVAFAGMDKEMDFSFETRLEAELNLNEEGEWSLVSGAGIITDASSPVTDIINLSLGQNVFRWTVSSAGCVVSDEIVIRIKDRFIPSVFTPNNDGKNDKFEVIPLGGKVEIIIFNRWGIQEYSDSDYANDWDGRNKHRNEMPDGTYFYVIKFEDGTVKKGTVLIKR